MVVAIAIAGSFAVAFLPGGEIDLIVWWLSFYLCVSMAAFVVTLMKATTSRTFAFVALAFAVCAVGIEELPAFGRTLAAQSSNPYKMGLRFDVETSLEFLLPIFAAILVQWRLTLGHWLKARGEARLSRWPWIVTAVAVIVALNPLGIDILQSAILLSPTDWFAALWRMVALIAAGVLIAAGLVEYYIRLRRSRRVGAES
jgi:hypothetical protein